MRWLLSKVIVCASNSVVFMLTWTLKARSSYHHAYATPCVDSTRISILLLCNAVAGHGLKTLLKAALDFGAESPRPREFQSSGKHALARYGPHTGETFLWLLYWRAMYTHNVRALLTSLQAANHVLSGIRIQ